MIIPGWVVSIATFPGVIVHEAAHQYFCKLFKIPVYKVVYFRFGNPAGYVVHGKTRKYRDIFWISVGPLVINSLLTIILCFPITAPLWILKCSPLPAIYYVLFWLGLSIGMNSFPSSGDREVLWNETKKCFGRSSATKRQTKGGAGILPIIGLPMVVFIYIANMLSIFWFDLIYAVFIGGMLPRLLIYLAAHL